MISVPVCRLVRRQVFQSDYKSFDDLIEAFRAQVRYFADIKIRGNNVIEKIFSKFLPVPFLSLLVEDCIMNGKDYNGRRSKIQYYIYSGCRDWEALLIS